MELWYNECIMARMVLDDVNEITLDFMVIDSCENMKMVKNVTVYRRFRLILQNQCEFKIQSEKCIRQEV